MSEFWQLLHSTSWWLSVVVVGVLASIIATYGVRGLDRMGLSFGRKWTERSARSKKQFDDTVDVLKKSAEARAAYFREEVRLRQTAIYTIAISVFLLGLMAGISGVDMHRLIADGAQSADQESTRFTILVLGVYVVAACATAFGATTAYSKAQLMARHLRAAEADLMS
ncbi:hypothetical protein [Burkholderia multivorans]|uniref:hypothetical protein n=1 Tax=Burkholderia multivorans TaxID=87883 RepID=UPI000569D278|nr:hypothetical protein [Burkholderia multivorans]MBU9445899.1 hypothetical protein [Burkholderia multivorans]PRF59921.1 hypothetical protein C6Q28_15380 [Burkholderia multivorans]